LRAQPREACDHIARRRSLAGTVYGSPAAAEDDFQPRPDVCRRRRPGCLDRFKKTSSNCVGRASDIFIRARPRSLFPRSLSGFQNRSRFQLRRDLRKYLNRREQNLYVLPTHDPEMALSRDPFLSEFSQSDYL
jgi:hypothetical protein